MAHLSIKLNPLMVHWTSHSYAFGRWPNLSFHDFIHPMIILQSNLSTPHPVGSTSIFFESTRHPVKYFHSVNTIKGIRIILTSQHHHFKEQFNNTLLNSRQLRNLYVWGDSCENDSLGQLRRLRSHKQRRVSYKCERYTVWMKFWHHWKLV